MPSQPPRVFIIYSHDSPAHEQRVLALAARLRKDGIDAQLDQYVAGTPAEGWPRWMLDRLDWAEFVLVVCTETYYRRFRRHEKQVKAKRPTGNEISSHWRCTTPKVRPRNSRRSFSLLKTSNSSQSHSRAITIMCSAQKTTTLNFMIS